MINKQFYNRMKQKMTVVDEQFINALFDHSLFKQNLKQALKLETKSNFNQDSSSIAILVSEISSLLITEVTDIAQNQLSKLQSDIKQVRFELEKVRELHYSQITRADYLSKQGSDDINFEDQQLFDLPSVRRTINELQERVREISMNSSLVLDTSELFRESRYKQDVIQERISTQIIKLEQNFACQQDQLEDLVNKKLEKQQKTINNILETLNELHTPSKGEKNGSLLSTSKSAVKLKTFFGFS